MAASDATKLVIRIAGNLDDLKKALAEGRIAIDNTATQLGRMTANFRGDKLIQDAQRMTQAVKDAGGAAVLTEKQQARVNAAVAEAIDKYRRLGQTAPAEMLELEKATARVEKETSTFSAGLGKVGALMAGAFTVSAVVNAGREFADYTGRINDLSAKTGIGTDALQKLSYAAKMNGVDVEQLAQGVVKLGKTLVEGPASAVQATNALGLKMADLKKMAPEEAFTTIGDAIAKIPNPMERSAIAVALFGKAGADYLPMFNGHLNETVKTAERLGLVLSNDLIKAGDDFGDMLDSLSFVKMMVLGKMFRWITEAIDSLIIRTLNFVAVWSGAFEKVLAFAAKLAVATGRTEIAAGLLNAAVAADKLDKEYTFLAGAAILLKKEHDEAAAAAGRQTKQVGELTGAFEKSSKAGKEMADLQNKLSGKDDIDRADKYIDSIKDMGGALGYAGGLAKMTGEKVDDVRKVMEAGAYAARAWGDTTKAAIFAVARELTLLQSRPLSVLFGGTPVATPTLPTLQSRDLSGYTSAPTATNMSAWIQDALKFRVSLEDIGQTAQMVGQVFSNINSTIGQSMQILGHGFEVLGDVGAKTSQKLVAGFAMFAGLLSELAGQSPGKFATAAIGAAGGALAGLSLTVSSMNPVIIGVGVAIGALVGAIIGWTVASKKEREANAAATEQIKDYEKELLKTYGSLEMVRTLGTIVGIDLAGAWGHQNQEGLKHFKELLDDFNQKMKDLQSALDTYGLTWLDLNDQMKQFTFGQAAAKILEDYRLLTNAGAPVTKVIKGMGDALSQLVVDAVKSGQKIPAALQPILEQLIKMGGLTEEAARALLGLSTVAVPSIADITAAAERYGLTLAQLGPKVQQLQITETAKQIIADWELLARAGADMGTVMNGMASSVQDLVTKALKFGLELPDSMRPLIEQMIQAGLLVDENGEKLTDLGKLDFALDLTKAFDTLIKKLDELIDKLTGSNGVAASIDRIPRDVDVHARLIYDGSYLPGGESDEDRQGAMAGGGLVPQYLGGGGRLLSFRPRGTDTVPAMLTPGEIVLNQAQQRNVAAGLEGGGNVTIHHYEIKAIDSQDVKQFFERRGVRAMAEAIAVDAGHQNDYAAKVLKRLVR